MTTDLIPAAVLDEVEIRTALGPTYADFSAIVSPDDGDEVVYAKVERAAVYVSQVYDSSRWWIADLLVFGEAILGDRFHQLADSIGLAPATLLDYLRVGSKVPRSRRRDALRFSHHRLVAPLSPEAQTYWLDRAEREALSVRDLEEEIRKTNEPRDDGPGAMLDTVEATVVPARVVEVAKRILATAKPVASGDYIVDREQIAQLRAALGEES
jgi:hypothetical protein